MEIATPVRDPDTDEISELILRSKRAGAAERVLEHVSDVTHGVITQCLRK